MVKPTAKLDVSTRLSASIERRLEWESGSPWARVSNGESSYAGADSYQVMNTGNNLLSMLGVTSSMADAISSVAPLAHAVLAAGERKLLSGTNNADVSENPTNKVFNFSDRIKNLLGLVIEK